MKKDLGLIHLYCGDGKGKTSSAMGVALRAVSNGYNVLIIQFLKRGTSSEVKLLEQFDNVKVLANTELSGWSFKMSDEEKVVCKDQHDSEMNKAIDICQNDEIDVLIIDEVVGTLNLGLISKDLVLDFLQNKPENLEVIMTGRNPLPELLELSDYVSEIKKIKHPFDNGIGARAGIDK